MRACAVRSPAIGVPGRHLGMGDGGPSSDIRRSAAGRDGRVERIACGLCVGKGHAEISCLVARDCSDETGGPVKIAALPVVLGETHLRVLAALRIVHQDRCTPHLLKVEKRRVVLAPRLALGREVETQAHLGCRDRASHTVRGAH